MGAPEVLNHYRVIKPLGKGGMGEVYVAEDTRLNRKVAVKVLSGLMAGDPERRERFEREARAIAALNHPNIVTIHSVEEAGGVPFLTMELVEGQPLAELLDKGALPTDAVLRVGIAVSDAIAAAHQRGITHRDLKPANIMVTHDGRVKVLDFGLAKLREAELDPDGATRLPSGDLTGEGRILGTVAYMSPEQAEGKPIDQRSDIFSLGVVLHEMATGERPFKGDTNVSVISAILKDTPSSVTDLNPALPAGLGKIIRRSLAKDPGRRYQTAIDLRNDLEELKQEVDSGVTVSITQRPKAAGRRAAPWAVIGALAAVLVLALAAVVYFGRGAESAPAVVFEADRFTRLTTTGNAQTAAISPDGRMVAHVKTEGTRPSLWIRQTAATSDVQIVPPAAVRYDGVSFSPDGNFVYYVTYEAAGGIGTLYRIPVLGGTPQPIINDIDSPVTFSPDGTEFAFLRGVVSTGRNVLLVANADGSGVRELAGLEAPEQFALDTASWSPDGRHLVAPVVSLRDGPHRALFVVDVGTGESRSVGGRWTAIADVQWMPDGQSMIVSAADFSGFSRQLWQIMYPSGERRRITNDLNNYVAVSISADGRTLATVQAEDASNVFVVAADGSGEPVQVTHGRGIAEGLFGGVSWTPDGRLVFATNRSGRPEIWITDVSGENVRQLTNDDRPSVTAAVTPDGRYVLFQRLDRTGTFLWRMALDGGGAVQITTGGADLQPVPSSDSRWVYFTSRATGLPLAFKAPVEGGQAVQLTPARFQPIDVSPETGAVLGIGWNEAEQRSTYATLPAAGGTPALLDLPVFGLARWTPGGRGITYVYVEDKGVNLWSRDPAKGEPRQLTHFSGSNIFAFDWSPDGKRLAVVSGQTSSDVVLITRK